MAWLHFEIFCYISEVVIVFYSIYSIMKTTSHNHQTWMKKRNTSLFYALNVSTLTVISSAIFWGICWIHGSFVMTSLATALYTFSTFIWIFMLSTKNWLIYYQYKWTSYIKQTKWQQIINPTVLDTDIYTARNWFISHHQTYGQLKYVFKLFGSVGICSGIITTSLWLLTAAFTTYSLHITISTCCMFILYTPWILLYVFCALNTPALDDVYKIHWESNMHAKSLCLTVPNAIIAITFRDTKAIFVAVFSGSIILFSMIFISTVYIRQKLSTPIMRLKSVQSIDTNQQIDDNITLQMVLSNEKSLNLFMNHLSTEYSMEILLCCIEIMQYQNYVKEFITDFGNVEDVQFPINTPISEILMDSNDKSVTENAKKKAHKLYKKYICEFAEFEVNISGTMRDLFKETFEDLDQLISDTSIGVNELYMVFEECKTEMISLQLISFERFKREKAFDIVKGA
eukprot:261411_1